MEKMSLQNSFMLNVSLVIMLTLVVVGCTSEHRKAKDVDAARVLHQLSSHVVSYLRQGEIDSLLEMYRTDVVYFPQYHYGIFNKSDLQDFYQRWIDSTTIVTMDRDIVDVAVVKDRAIETGTFSMDFERGGSKNTYRGKYMVIWKEENNSYKVEAESFCSDSYLPKDGVPYITTLTKYTKPIYELDASDDIENEIKTRNDEVIKNVESGSGRGRTEGYHREAIYMPNFSKMMIGLDRISPFLFETYFPGSNIFARHSFYDVRPIDEDHVIIAAHFKGGWNRSNSTGEFEGNMLNVRKRQNGKLIMYRQLVNSDR